MEHEQDAVIDVPALAGSLPVLDLARGPTREEALAAAASLGSFNRCELAIARFRGRPPWERHPDDELIHVLHGSVELTLWRSGDDVRRVPLATGALFVVPARVWHRSYAADSVTVLAATSREGNQSAFGEAPPG